MAFPNSPETSVVGKMADRAPGPSDMPYLLPGVRQHDPAEAGLLADHPPTPHLVAQLYNRGSIDVP